MPCIGLQVADMATQTFTPAQLPLPLPLPGQPLGSVLQDTAHTALYGVNAAVASGGAANGAPPTKYLSACIQCVYCYAQGMVKLVLARCAAASGAEGWYYPTWNMRDDGRR